ncbi:MAG: YbaB/EbfC family nucleoid-associated protein [Treponema sp.]|nr:YbaB/EbfC family nucleoid-associated protein [Treponema sp.]
MNPFDLFKNSQAIKEQLEKTKDEIMSLTATGSSGGRMITVTVNGKFEMVDIHLDPICVDNRDIKMLEDLIVAAQHDAVSNMQQLIQEKAGPMFSGMNIPGLNL